MRSKRSKDEVEVRSRLVKLTIPAFPYGVVQVSFSMALCAPL